MEPITSSSAEATWKKLFIAFGALTFIILPLLSHAYGQSGDEWLQIVYGQDIWNYFFHGDQQALSYDVLLHPGRNMTQFQGQHLYGGLFDFSTEALHHWFPGIPLLTLRHFCNALTSALMMVSTGLIARRLSGRWSVGFLALLFIFFSPRIFGEGMNNPKDIPFGAGFALAVYAVLALLQDGKRRIVLHSVLLALGFGLAFGVRSAGGLLFGVYMVAMIAGYLIFDKERRTAIWTDKKVRTRLALAIVGSLVVGYVIGLLAWPWGAQSPISHPIESLQGMTNRDVAVRTLFEGEYTVGAELPSHYELKWIFISNPISVIIGAVLFLLFALRIRKARGTFVMLFPVFGALFPLLYMVYKHSVVYDTWRHVFFVYPFWVVMAAIGWWMAGEFVLSKIKRTKDVLGKPLYWMAIPVALLIPAVIWTLKEHPNQAVYFNEFAGGIKGANGQYETDYYYNSSAQDVAWILKDIPRTPGKKSIILTNMGGFGPNCFLNDTAFTGSDYCRPDRLATRDWDYYIIFPRNIPDEMVLNENWVPQDAAYVVKAGGVPLSAVIKNPHTAPPATAAPAGK